MSDGSTIFKRWNKRGGGNEQRGECIWCGGVPPGEAKKKQENMQIVANVCEKKWKKGMNEITSERMRGKRTKWDSKEDARSRRETNILEQSDGRGESRTDRRGQRERAGRDVK